MSDTIASAGPFGVIAALPKELGSLAEGGVARSIGRLEVIATEVGGAPVLATISGVGKVCAARAASLLVAEGVRGFLVVGTCGGLVRGLVPGALVHCTTAFQTDLAVREGREVEAYAPWRETWKSVRPGAEGWFLTADRPVITPWRRLRLRRAFQGICVADMETAAVAAVARLGALPWAALRIVTDMAGPLTARRFRENYPTLAPLPADSLMDLLPRLV
ncbi:MAG: hypothetical protein O2816_01710 [Planctomycetota bacterium]|nr:hypothetical protein [Planctomycetota bacterium]